jgi:hypothetical protein
MTALRKGMLFNRARTIETHMHYCHSNLRTLHYVYINETLNTAIVAVLRGKPINRNFTFFSDDFSINDCQLPLTENSF